jgi:acyl-coenzyme A thioesterase PaaI-like protein
MDIQEHLKTARRTGELEFFIEERREDCVVSRMPVIPGALNPFGTVQAGALLWMADVTATGLASFFKKAGFVECARRSETRPIMRYYIN